MDDYKYLRFSPEHKFDGKATAQRLKAKHKQLASSNLDDLEFYCNQAYNLAIEVTTATEDRLGFQHLFFLARRLMTRTKADQRRKPGTNTALAPFALIYVESLNSLDNPPEGFEGGFLDWDDDDQVILSFEEQYLQVKVAEDEDIPATAMSLASAQPLRITLKPPIYAKLLSYAYQLQLMQGSQDIVIPQERTGELLECSAAFVGQMIRKAIREGYLEDRGPYSKKDKLAKPYRFIKQLNPMQKPISS